MESNRSLSKREIRNRKEYSTHAFEKKRIKIKREVMRKHPTDTAYCVGYSLQSQKYIVYRQSKFSSKHFGWKFGTEEEAQKEVDKLNEKKWKRI